MKTLIILISALLFSETGTLLAQISDTSENITIEYKRSYSEDKQEMKTLFNGDNHTGGYFAVNFKGNNYLERDVLFLGVKMVGVINRSLGIGFELNAMAPSVKLNDLELDYLPAGGSVRPLNGYGGLLIEPILFSNQPVHVTFPMLLGLGWAAYVRDWNEEVKAGEKDLLDDTVFFVFEPGINAEFNLTRHMRLGLGVSYRATNNFDLENTSSNAFNGINYNMNLKFGRF